MTPVLGIPDHLHAELDRLGVRAPAQRKPRPPVVTPDIGWYKRGEECPF